MKKTAAFIILFLFALLLWNICAWNGNATVNFDGDDIGGPLGALLATLLAGGGMLLGGVILLVVGGVLAVVFAGVGMLLVGGLGLGALLLALAVSPLLLPLLVPAAIVWYLAGRARRHRIMQQPV